MGPLPAAFYEPDGESFASTPLTRGPWDPGLQHAGPPAALLARAIEGASAIEAGHTVRLSYDILRPIPITPLRIETRVLRPGRRVEQLEATLTLAHAGSDAAALMRATAWRMRTEKVPLPPGSVAGEPPATGPDDGRPGDFSFWTDEVAYHRALDWRFVAGVFDRPGPAHAWTRLNAQLVAGEPPTPLERLLVMADAASGVSAALDWSGHTFVNVDLGIHLLRPPEGEWMSMDAVTRLSSSGTGLCTSVLGDARGQVGVSTQSLLVAERPGAG